MSHNRRYPRSAWRKIRPVSTRNSLHQIGTDPSTSQAFASLVHSLKEATACRSRLGHLLPGVFGAAACAKQSDPREEWEREAIRVVNKVYRDLDGPDAEQMSLSASPSDARKTSTLPEDLSELDEKDYHALSPDAQLVVRNEYSAWKTWEKVLQKDKEAFEKQFPKWEQMDCPASAQLRHLWSIYGQSQLGLSRTTLAKHGLLAEAATSEQVANQELADKQYIEQGIKIWGEPPPGVPPVEHIIRCSVLASRGLPWTYPSQEAGNPSPAGNQNAGGGEK